MGGISRLYQIFCKEYNFNLEIIDEEFLENHKPLKKQKELLVIAGGDGTIHRVVNIIPDEFLSCYKFGIISAGTANEFASSLNIPLILEEAAFLIANEENFNTNFHTIGVVNDKYKFLTGLLYGVACQVLQSTSQTAKIRWGAFAYNLPGLFSITYFTEHIKKFRLDSKEFYTGYLIINNASLSGKKFSIDDIKDENRDLFSLIYVQPDLTPSDMVRLIVKNQTHLNILQDASIYYVQMKEITLQFEEQSQFMLDGELYEFSSPLNIRHHRNNIEVIC